ncbi:aminotransferase class III-fold pyridoxal phosphate-dependent enzyme [Ruegeria sp. 2012CJ41-6]|uniref:Aminotransferase class III-fold pyridoxal phosphate-dependent enzyme n=1 Tax=Ruegeria spongiae TaxID=2942209 RepID=A0ABT0Q2T2_9RHOB|nr:aminotransferase class III-fold pyridoxal phosphate-dependent enzyme [Ruegeria spongiae]MCL6284185.1 aminotransferase class III-fold pyridoxal phosphate-dependent enzyme [Ruegeria spongiae]
MLRNDKRLIERAEQVVPGGVYGHMSTYLMPDGVPQYYTKSKGTYLWDADGNKYFDCLSAYGPNLLGYGNAQVQDAIRNQLEHCDTMSGPSPLMVDLAEAMVDMIDHANWAMFCKNGTDATSIATTIARAKTGRSKIVVGRGIYHGCLPWSTPSMEGVQPADRMNLIYFDVTDMDSFTDAVRQAGDDLAGVIVTPYRHEVFGDQHFFPQEMAQLIRKSCDEKEAVLILDEVRTGFRLSVGSAWSEHGVQPDISCWGKMLGNGQPISAVLGTDEVKQAASSIYVTGSFWFSAVPMAAAIETLRQVREGSYFKQIMAYGRRLRAGLEDRARAFGFELSQTGPVTMPQILFREDPDFRIAYRFCQLLAQNGVLFSPYHNMFMNAGMTDEAIDGVLETSEKVFAELKDTRGNIPAIPDRVTEKLNKRKPLLGLGQKQKLA